MLGSGDTKLIKMLPLLLRSLESRRSWRNSRKDLLSCYDENWFGCMQKGHLNQTVGEVICLAPSVLSWAKEVGCGVGLPFAIHTSALFLGFQP